MEFALLWFLLSVAVGIGASRRCNRSGFGWFLLSVVLSPVLGAAFLVALGPRSAPEPDAQGAVEDSWGDVLKGLGVWIVFGLVVGTMGAFYPSSPPPTTVELASARPAATQIVTGPVAIIGAAQHQTTQAPTRVGVPTDPRAQYTVVSVERSGQGLVSITTRRDGPSGTSYARRLVDCKRKLFRYTAEADTLSGLGARDKAGTMAALVEGSISYYVSMHACSAETGR